MRSVSTPLDRKSTAQQVLVLYLRSVSMPLGLDVTAAQPVSNPPEPAHSDLEGLLCQPCIDCCMSPQNMLHSKHLCKDPWRSTGRAHQRQHFSELLGLWVPEQAAPRRHTVTPTLSVFNGALQDDKAFHVTADIPGVDKDRVDVSSSIQLLWMHC